jgi:5-methylcytosine-specific restriction endonuclease McrA
VLERRVAEASDDDDHDANDEPAAVRWTSSRSIEVRVTLPAAAWALLERAMEGARQKSESSLSDAEALEAVARDALSHQASAADRADLRSMVVLYTCRSCERGEVETGAGPIEIGEAEAAILACDAKRCDLESEGRTVSHDGAVPAPVRRAVMLRDRMRCRVPGCTGRRYVDVHHLIARADGGEHSRRNCLLLCGRCHTRVHDGRLRIEGDAEDKLRVYDASGEPIEQATTPAGHPGETEVSGAAAKLLKLIATAGGSNSDWLCAESGLAASEVSCALLELQLAARVRMGNSGYESIAPLARLMRQERASNGAYDR